MMKMKQKKERKKSSKTLINDGVERVEWIQIDNTLASSML